MSCKGYKHTEESKKLMRDNHHGLKGPTHPMWQGGRRINAFGYIEVYCPCLALLSKNPYMREHTLIAGRALGRPLKKGEVVHHINGDKTDNRNLNMVICTNKYNSWLHHRMAQLYMEEHFGENPTLVSKSL